MTPNSPTLLASVVSAAYVPLALLIDAIMVRHRAVLTTLVIGFLFLPSVSWDLPGLIAWNRTTAPSIVIFLGILLRDNKRFTQLQIKSVDLPMTIFCLAPGLSSLANNAGAYDALSSQVYSILQFGIPYLIGRAYFTSHERLRDFYRIVMIGGLVYVPLCLYEFRFSPNLHALLYGFHQHGFLQTIRAYYYRPMVFLQHGLMLAMWLGMTLMMTIGLRIAEPRSRIAGIPLSMLIVVFGITFLLCQSVGAIVIVAISCGLLIHHLSRGNTTLMLMFAITPILWVGMRATSAIEADSLNALSAVFGEERTSSLKFRLMQEDSLMDHIAQKPLLGWSRWDMVNPENSGEDQDAPIVDSLWIITLSAAGWVGLIALLSTYLVPILLAWRHLRFVPSIHSPSHILLACSAVLLSGVMTDNLFNAMVNPLFLVLMGSVTSLSIASSYSPPTSDFHEVRQASDARATHSPRILGQ